MDESTRDHYIAYGNIHIPADSITPGEWAHALGYRIEYTRNLEHLSGFRPLVELVTDSSRLHEKNDVVKTYIMESRMVPAELHHTHLLSLYNWREWPTGGDWREGLPQSFVSHEVLLSRKREIAVLNIVWKMYGEKNECAVAVSFDAQTISPGNYLLLLQLFEKYPKVAENILFGLYSAVKKTIGQKICQLENFRHIGYDIASLARRTGRGCTYLKLELKAE